MIAVPVPPALTKIFLPQLMEPSLGAPTKVARAFLMVNFSEIRWIPLGLFGSGGRMVIGTVRLSQQGSPPFMNSFAV